MSHLNCFEGGSSKVLLYSNSWSVSFPLRKIWRISLMPQNFRKSKKCQKSAMICFIEGISTFLKVQHVKLLQNQCKFAGTPNQQLTSKSRFWSFSTMKYFKLNWCNIECFVEIDIKSNELKILDLKYNQFVCPWNASNSLHFWSNSSNCCWFAFEIWILLMQNSNFWKNQKFLVLKLLFQMTSYHRASQR